MTNAIFNRLNQLKGRAEALGDEVLFGDADADPDTDDAMDRIDDQCPEASAHLLIAYNLIRQAEQHLRLAATIVSKED